MTATNEQIIEEARRRQNRAGECELLSHYIIEVTREGWKPPEPVDPDVLAFREWFTADRCTLSSSVRISLDRGDYDKIEVAKAYLAGARMAREQEQERAKFLVRFAKARAHLILDAAHALAAYKAGRADQ